MTRPVAGKVVLITGAGSGIGRHLAQCFVSEGARVAVTDIDLAAAVQTAHMVSTAGAGHALPFGMDVTSERDVKRGMAEVRSAWGPVDVLIANAGVQHISPFEEFGFDAWQRVMAVHVDGAFLISRAIFQDSVQHAKSSSILVMGSIHSHVAARFKAAYITAKHALSGLVKSIAKEGGPHDIRAYLICPGFVDTPLVRKQIPEQAARLGKTEDEIIRNIMLGDTVDGQFTTVEELAQVALFLAAFPTPALTGQSFVVSHGADMH